MNDQLQKQLAEILNQMQTAVTNTADYSLKQLPDIASQYIYYGFWSNLLGLIISGAFIVACVFLCGKLLSLDSRKFPDSDAEGVVKFFGILGTIFLVVMTILLKFYPSLESLILNLTAPKVWLILEIKNLLS